MPQRWTMTPWPLLAALILWLNGCQATPDNVGSTNSVIGQRFRECCISERRGFDFREKLTDIGVNVCSWR